MFNSINLSPFSQFQPQQDSSSTRADSIAAFRDSSLPAFAVQSQRVSERFSNEESFTVSLLTREGDLVEISFSSLERYAADYGSRQTPGRSSEFLAISQSQKSEFGFSVKGDLSVEEIDAISSLVQDLNQIADEFFNGDIQSAFNQAGELQMDTSQLASLDVSMQQSMQYRAIEQYRQVQAMGENQSNGRQLQPYLQSLTEQVSRSEAFISQASQFSFTLLNELILRDSRSTELPQPEILSDSLQQIRDIVESMITQTGESVAVESETDEDA